jgi:hypothetical protein
MPEKPKDDHPADQLLDAIKGLFNGDNARKSLRDAYDRITGDKPTAPAPKPEDTSWHDARVKAANKSFLDADQAARVRAQAGKVAGK